MRKVASHFTFLQNTSIHDNKKKGGFSYPLLQSIMLCCFGWSLRKKFNLTQILLEKRKSITLIFQDNCGYSLILLLTSGNFLKVICNIESEKISMNFLYTATLKVMYRAWIDLWPMPDFVTSYIDDLENIYALIHVDLSNVDTFAT